MIHYAFIIGLVGLTFFATVHQGNRFHEALNRECHCHCLVVDAREPQ